MSTFDFSCDDAHQDWLGNIVLKVGLVAAKPRFQLLSCAAPKVLCSMDEWVCRCSGSFSISVEVDPMSNLGMACMQVNRRRSSQISVCSGQQQAAASTSDRIHSHKLHRDD